MGVIERKEREKEYRRNQILEAGEKLFLQKGFENVTMDEIAKECELSKGTLYLYYKSKDELFYILILKGMEVLISMFQEGIKNAANFQEKMNALGSQYLKFHEQYPSYYKMVNYMGDHRNIKREGLAELEKILAQKNNEIWRINVELFHEGIDKGIFKSDFDPFEFSVMLWAASNGMIQVLDHMKLHSECAPEILLNEFSFCSLNYEQTLNNLWDRLISTILVNPSKFSRE